MNDAPQRVFAVIATYLPEIEPLGELITILSPQVTRILIIDNTPEVDERVLLLCDKMALTQVELVRLGRNFGIARAFNVGIKAAISAGATHVLLSDQDSQPAPDMVQGLIRAERDLTERGIPLAAVGPSFINVNSGDIFPFHVKIKGRLLHGRRCATIESPHVETLNLISSGTLVSISAIKSIGLMREDFFIDSVDTEWCYRARSLGYCLYGTGWATMRHRMGDSNLRVWYFGWSKANAHSPLRIYYQVRNLVRLHYLGYKGVRWRIRSVFSIMAIFYCHAFFGSTKLAALRMALRGLRDGLCGRMGEFIP
jgi:rhamnosyltransferase